jgi:hypothetical protein
MVDDKSWVGDLGTFSTCMVETEFCNSRIKGRISVVGALYSQ